MSSTSNLQRLDGQPVQFSDEENRPEGGSGHTDPETTLEGQVPKSPRGKFPIYKLLIGVGLALLAVVILLLVLRSSKTKPFGEMNVSRIRLLADLKKNPYQVDETGVYKLTKVHADAYTVNATGNLTGVTNNFGGDSNPQVQNLSFTSRLLSSNHFQLKFTDNSAKRFEVPNEFPFPVLEPEKPIPWKNSVGELYYTEDAGDDFTVEVRRKNTKETLWNLQNRLIYSKLYIEFTTHLPNGYTYGLGERTGPLQLKDGRYTLWPKDTPFKSDTGEQGAQTYGYHPVYLIREESGNFSLVFLRISNAVDAIINSTAQTLTFKIAGQGILDVHVILGGNNPEDLMAQYHNYIRRWNVPPFWSLGWQQCRWGYTNLDLMEYVLGNYSQYKLPLDVLWSDIDYMRGYIDFTIDEHRYPIDKFNDMLTKYKKRWVPIIDAGVGITNKTEITNKRLAELDVGIKNPDGNGYLIGEVWPGLVYYVDFWNNNSDTYWGEMLEMLYQKVPFSGIWLDMNELSNFCNGSCEKNQTLSFEPMPYSPGGAPLWEKTLDLGALHANGFQELDVHVFNGYLESKATYDYLKTKSPLPFIISRSTAYGSNQFANHWTGDNVATEEFLEYSVPTIMAFNLFGIPFTGSDICGFGKDASELLCARWHQVGAWYPFARNHHINTGRSQEPYAYGDTSIVLSTALVALRYRYAHLRHYHTQFLLKNGTGTVFRPLFFEFPSEEALYNKTNNFTERQFLVGDALMLAPSYKAVEIETYQAYFPSGSWFDYKNGAQMTEQKNTGVVRTIESKLNDTAPVFIRGGKIVFAEFTSAATVNDSDGLANQFTMTIALNKTTDEDHPYAAQGTIMGTSNVTDNYIWEKCVLQSCMVQATAKGNSSALEVSFKTHGDAKISIDGARIWGLKARRSQMLKGIGPAASSVQVAVKVNGNTINTYTAKLGDHGDITLEDANIQVDSQTVISFDLKN